jgi:hypothetical protein
MKTTIALLSRAFRRSAPVISTSRAQWSAVKAAALASDRRADLTTIAHAEMAAHEHIAQTYGASALVYPTEAQLDELCAVALDSLPGGFFMYERAAARTTTESVAVA